MTTHVRSAMYKITLPQALFLLPPGIARYCPRHTLPWEYSRSRDVVCDALVSAPDVPVRDGTLEPGVMDNVLFIQSAHFLFSVIIPKFVELI